MIRNTMVERISNDPVTMIAVIALRAKRPALKSGHAIEPPSARIPKLRNIASVPIPNVNRKRLLASWRYSCHGSTMAARFCTIPSRYMKVPRALSHVMIALSRRMKNRNTDPDDNDQRQVSLQPIDHLLCGGGLAGAAAPAAAVGILKGAVAASVFAALGEKRAKAKHEPLADIERLEQYQLRSLHRSIDWLGHRDGHGGR